VLLEHAWKVNCDCRTKLFLHEDDCLAVISGEPSPATTSCLVQEYIDKPLLIGGYKSHMRLYVLITSADPLRVFVYEDGLMHLATQKYLSPAEGNLVSGFFNQFFCGADQRAVKLVMDCVDIK